MELVQSTRVPEIPLRPSSFCAHDDCETLLHVGRALGRTPRADTRRDLALSLSLELVCLLRTAIGLGTATKKTRYLKVSKCKG